MTSNPSRFRAKPFANQRPLRRLPPPSRVRRPPSTTPAAPARPWPAPPPPRPPPPHPVVARPATRHQRRRGWKRSAALPAPLPDPAAGACPPRGRAAPVGLPAAHPTPRCRCCGGRAGGEGRRRRGRRRAVVAAAALAAAALAAGGRARSHPCSCVWVGRPDRPARLFPPPPPPLPSPPLRSSTAPYPPARRFPAAPSALPFWGPC